MPNTAAPSRKRRTTAPTPANLQAIQEAVARRVAEPEHACKPSIEDVFAAFQQYQTDQRHGISSLHEPGRWEQALVAARARLQTRLTELGLAQHIDWTDRSNG